mgnify:CR=1 FL=1|jgi:hypothetical protein
MNGIKKVFEKETSLGMSKEAANLKFAWATPSQIQ